MLLHACLLDVDNGIWAPWLDAPPPDATYTAAMSGVEPEVPGALGRAP